MVNCIVCNKQLKGRQRKFCSVECDYNAPRKKKWRENNKEYYKKYSNSYKKKTKNKINARNMAERNIIIVSQLCEDCNINPATHRHHEDYTKPLEVVLLCTDCHRKRHKQLNLELIERRF